jgi:hypothetical protein
MQAEYGAIRKQKEVAAFCFLVTRGWRRRQYTCKIGPSGTELFSLGVSISTVSLQSMPKYHGPKEELDAARSPGASRDELSVLAESQHSFVREAVADHPNTDPFVLAELVPINLLSAPDQYIASAIARNANAPSFALERIAAGVLPFLDNGREHQKHFEVGVALCCNANTSQDTIIKLLDYEQTSATFRKVVARETKCEDVVRLLLLDRSETVRKQASQTLTQLQSKQ